ncbi:hypothetical protein PUR49_20605 [Streptomyces sp. BE147]|uniref:hypothetical protein n=1 Tax=Streptomyces sp. BE147 TaxID=3002524 RepID=UPI002E78EC28|nr:hypothetical protein [Streptomyces sp. BE147]MEE1738891.1 hypothetical protein [Streptomyces sp. BE147]
MREPAGPSRPARNGRRGGFAPLPALPVVLAALVLVPLLPVLLLLGSSGARAADGEPKITLSKSEAGKGGAITVKGSGWRADTLLMLLICGQSTPDRGVIGGTNSCANAEGRAVTTGKSGAFSKKMPVSEPPKPCPCVVHVATVTGERASAEAVFTVAGHPTAPLPQPDGGKLAVLATTRLEGDSSLLTWFGAPASRRLVLTVGNLGSAPVKDPVFQVGTSHGVYAPRWEEHQWRGTVAPGRKAQIKLPVELAAGAHGDYRISLKYGTKVLAEQPWGVGRPWGVTLFWILLCVVVPAAVFRIGMAIVDKVRPRPDRAGARTGRHRHPQLSEVTARLPGLRRGDGTAPERPSAADPAATTTTTAALPWFTPDSAPSDNRPTTKGHS